jgi:hypothetical protein
MMRRWVVVCGDPSTIRLPRDARIGEGKRTLRLPACHLPPSARQGRLHAAPVPKRCYRGVSSASHIGIRVPFDRLTA